MSMHQSAEVIGDGLHIPRIIPALRAEAPAYTGMGALVGPGSSRDTLNVVVTAKNHGISFLLGHDYDTAAPGCVGFALEGDDLVAHTTRGADGKRGGRVALGAWPLPYSYEIPTKSNKDGEPIGLTEIAFTSLQPFFDAEKDRYDAARTVREDGIAVYGMQLLFQNRYGRPQRNRYLGFHDGSVLVAATKAGELAVLRLGKLGASNYVLKDRGKKLTRGYHDYLVKDGKVHGRIREQSTRFAQTRLNSRHIPKIPLASAEV